MRRPKAGSTVSRPHHSTKSKRGSTEPPSQTSSRNGTTTMRNMLRAAALILLAAPTVTMAHHGFRGRYDATAPVYVEGYVVSAYFGQPHPLLTLRASGSRSMPAEWPDIVGGTTVRIWAGPGELATVELPPTSLFFSLRESVAVGDRVAVVALRNCSPPHDLRGQRIKLADGREVSRTGPVQTETAGC